MLELRLLGPLEISDSAGGGAHALLRRSKRAALLAYLAAASPRGLHRRDKLVALFWPESDAAHARAALNQALYVLREALGEDAIIAGGDDGAGLNTDVVWCDVAAFESALDEGRPAEALALYRADLLDGFHASGAAGFEEWLERERTRLRQRASDGAWALALERAAALDAVEAGRWARRAADFLPADEAVVRRLMAFLETLGDRAGAIQAYEAFVQRLAQEYDLEPSAETLTLAEAIRRRHPRADPESSDAAVAAPPAGDSPLRDDGTSTPRRRRVSRLRQAGAVAGAIVMAGLLGTVLVLASDEATIMHDPPRIVVLSFENIGSPEDEYFADGITDEITGRLAQIGGLLVISRTSAMQYKGSGASLRRIGEELGVAWVLEGTIRTERVRDGPGEVRVIPRLVRVADDAQIWTDRYTARLLPGEIFRVQADIAERVAAALDVTLREDERVALAATPTEDLLAYDHYLRGNQYYGRSFNESDTRLAADMYERAAAADSRFALAWARLAMAHARMYWFFWDRSAERLGRARRAVEHARDLDPDHPEVRLALGYYHYWGRNAYDDALEEFRAVERLQPNNAELFEALGNVRRRQGGFEDAAAHFGSAFVRNPRSAIVAFILAQTLVLTGDYEQAAYYFDRAVALRPEFVNAYWNQARLHLISGAGVDQAMATLDASPAAATDPLIGYHAVLVDLFAGRLDRALGRLESMDVDAVETQFFFVPIDQVKAQIHLLRADSSRATSHYEAARRVAERLLRKAPDEPNYLAAFAIASAGLGRRDEAIGAASRAAELLPVAKDAWRALFRIEDLARVQVMLGDHQAALETFERLAALPGGQSVSFVELDPAWAPLRAEIAARFATHRPAP